MVGQRFGQALVDRKGPAPVPVFFSVGDECRVGVEAVEDRLKQRMANVDAAALWQCLTGLG